jgi:hypothetical protein
MAWIGLVIAIALFCAELMFNASFDELSWTAVILGLVSYVYSIHTNIVGFYFYRGMVGTLFTNFDMTSFGGGIFMDVYPEVAIAWALKEGKVGDWIGNIIKTINESEKLGEQSYERKDSSNSNRTTPQSRIESSQGRQNINKDDRQLRHQRMQEEEAMRRKGRPQEAVPQGGWRQGQEQKSYHDPLGDEYKKFTESYAPQKRK